MDSSMSGVGSLNTQPSSRSGYGDNGLTEQMDKIQRQMDMIEKLLKRQMDKITDIHTRLHGEHNAAALPDRAAKRQAYGEIPSKDVKEEMPEEEQIEAFWFTRKTLVDKEQLSKARRCQQQGLHRVGEVFADFFENAELGWEYHDKGAWFDCVRDRGMEIFARLGWSAVESRRAVFRYFKSGKNCPSVCVMCKMCQSMHLAVSETSKFPEKAEKEFLEFFMIDQ